MERRLQRVVGPHLEKVAGVDYDGARHVRHGAEHARLLRILNLEPAHTVLEEQGDGAKVAVGRAALGGAALQQLARDRRVVQDARLVVGVLVVCGEITFVEAQAERQRPQDVELELVAKRVEAVKKVAEARQIVLGQPDIWHLRVVFSPHLVRFLHVRHLPQLRDRLFVKDLLRHLLQPNPGVPAVPPRFRRVRSLVLDLLREGEELCGLGEELSLIASK